MKLRKKKTTNNDTVKQQREKIKNPWDKNQIKHNDFFQLLQHVSSLFSFLDKSQDLQL